MPSDISWQEIVARTLLVLTALVLVLILAPQNTGPRVVPCLDISRVPAHCTPHR